MIKYFHCSEMQKSIILAITLALLSIIAYQHDIALFLIMFLLPLFIFKNIHKQTGQIIYLAYIFALFFIYTFIILFSETINISPINNAIVILINIYLFSDCAVFIYNSVKNKINPTSPLLIGLIFLLNIAVSYIFWKTPANIYAYITISFGFSIPYSLLMMRCFNKKLCIYINLVLSVVIPLAFILFYGALIDTTLITLIISGKTI